MSYTPFHHCGNHLDLREFRDGDAPDIQRLHADPRVRAMLPDTQPLQEPEWARDFVVCLGDYYRRHPGLGIWRCAVRQPYDPPFPAWPGRFAGWFSLMPMHRTRENRILGVGDAAAELGSRLMTDHWGTGLVLRGCEELLNHAFTTQGLETVWGVCHPDNRNARASLQALGFGLRGLAMYEGQRSEHHALEAATWARVRSMRVRERLRALRAIDEAPSAGAGAARALHAPHCGQP